MAVFTCWLFDWLVDSEGVFSINRCHQGYQSVPGVFLDKCLTEALGKVLLAPNTLPNTTARFVSRSILVSENSVSSVRPQYRYPTHW